MTATRSTTGGRSCGRPTVNTTSWILALRFAHAVLVHRQCAARVLPVHAPRVRGRPGPLLAGRRLRALQLLSAGLGRRPVGRDARGDVRAADDRRPLWRRGWDTGRCWQTGPGSWARARRSGRSRGHAARAAGGRADGRLAVPVSVRARGLGAVRRLGLVLGLAFGKLLVVVVLALGRSLRATIQPALLPARRRVPAAGNARALVSFGLLFGNTWFVNALVFFAVLLSVLASIGVAAVLPRRRPAPWYLALFASLALGLVRAAVRRADRAGRTSVHARRRC